MISSHSQIVRPRPMPMLDACAARFHSFPVRTEIFSFDAGVRPMPSARQPTEPACAQAQPDDAMTAEINKRQTAIRMVLPFVFRHWLMQPVRAAVVAGGL